MVDYSKLTFIEIPFYSLKYYCKKHPIRAGLWTGFTGLGFYRGWQAEKYFIKDENRRRLEHAETWKTDYKPESFMYSKAIIRGLVGSLFYWNFCTMPFMIGKEIYRAEINLRNLEDEKENNLYKYIWF